MTKPERDWIIIQADATDEVSELRVENHAIHSELAKLRELLDMAIVQTGQSWQAHDAVRRQLDDLQKPQPKRPRHRPPTVTEALVFRTLHKHMRTAEPPSDRRDLAPIVKAAAADLRVTPARVNQIIRRAMARSGLTWLWRNKSEPLI
jgi:hypothetical protein